MCIQRNRGQCLNKISAKQSKPTNKHHIQVENGISISLIYEHVKLIQN